MWLCPRGATPLTRQMLSNKMPMIQPRALLPCCQPSWQTMQYQVCLSYLEPLNAVHHLNKGKNGKATILDGYKIVFSFLFLYSICQAVRLFSHPAPLSQTQVSLVPVPKELSSLMMLGRRERQLMASFRFLSTRERTSHLMRFYNHSLGMISPHIFVLGLHLQAYSGCF